MVVLNLSVYEYAARVSSYPGYLNSLRIYIIRRGPKFAKGPVLAEYLFGPAGPILVEENLSYHI